MRLLLLIFVFNFFVFVPLSFLATLDGRAKADCSMAEFSPDYTTAMKARCRGLR